MGRPCRAVFAKCFSGYASLASYFYFGCFVLKLDVEVENMVAIAALAFTRCADMQYVCM